MLLLVARFAHISGRLHLLAVTQQRQHNANLMQRVVLVIGSSGTIGQGVVAALQGTYKVIRASRTSGDVNVDATNADSIRAMFDAVGSVDQ